MKTAKLARIHKNVWGNWKGYIGNKRVIEFAGIQGDKTGLSQQPDAEEWLEERRKEGYRVKESK